MFTWSEKMLRGQLPNRMEQTSIELTVALFTASKNTDFDWTVNILDENSSKYNQVIDFQLQSDMCVYVMI